MGVDSCDNFLPLFLIFKLLYRGVTVMKCLLTLNVIVIKHFATVINTVFITCKVNNFSPYRGLITV